jgi:hypothetical protein
MQELPKVPADDEIPALPRGSRGEPLLQLAGSARRRPRLWHVQGTPAPGRRGLHQLELAVNRLERMPAPEARTDHVVVSPARVEGSPCRSSGPRVTVKSASQRSPLTASSSGRAWSWVGGTRSSCWARGGLTTRAALRPALPQFTALERALRRMAWR